MKKYFALKFGTFIGTSVLIFFTLLFSLNHIIDLKNQNYVNEKLYPIGATEYIKENIDYKNMRIYNSYTIGSYLMLNDIPVFIDSRLDVYCSEFNDTDIFYDYVQIESNKNIEEIFEKYDFTHLLFNNDSSVMYFLKNNSNYSVLYEDEYFTLFSRNS